MYFSEYPITVFLEKSDTSNNAILEREFELFMEEQSNDGD